jgi:hypothetical protein
MSFIRVSAVIGIIIAVIAFTPFVVFQASNNAWIPYVLGGLLLVCMIALIPVGKSHR